MCVYCTNGTECPYLLNPFEGKLKNFNRHSRKPKPKDHYASERATFHHHSNDRVRPHMGDYYHDRYSRLGTEASRSRARHVLSEHPVMSGRHLMDRRLHSSHGNEYYAYPERYESSRGERGYQYSTMESLSKKRRLQEQEQQLQQQQQQQKQKATQDVWDNGYGSSRDTIRGVDRLDPNRAKNSGKDGPREKQRLTQDLEKQRKKLQEDMERGQVLRREHTQLLTRDLPRTKDDGTTVDDDNSPEPDTEETDERSYSKNRNWSSYSTKDTSPRVPSREKTELLGVKNNVEGQTEVKSGQDGNETREGLEACECKEEEDKDTAGADIRDELGREVDEMQCEHSSSVELNNGECDSKYVNRRERKEINGGNDISKYKDVFERENGNDERIFTSETLEVIGQSNDIDNKPLPGEGNKERCINNKGSKRKTGTFSKTIGKSHKKPQKGEKNSSDQENGRHRKSLEGKEVGNGCTKEEAQLEVSSATDIDDSAQNKTEDTNDDVDVENIVTQNRVRSDLPRHNWLIERLRNEKKLPGNCDGKKTEEELLGDVKGEVTSSTAVIDQNTELVKAPAQSTTSPILDEKDIEDSLHSLSKTTSREEQRNFNEHQSNNDRSNNSSPNLKVVSPSQSEDNLSGSVSPELARYSPTACKDNELKNKPTTLLEVRDSPVFNAKNSQPDETGGNYTNKDNSEEANEAVKFINRKSSQDSDDNNIQITEVEKLKKDEKIIEIKSDGEGSDDAKQNEQNSKITTGKSVNPVSPFLRSERHLIEKTGGELRRHDMIPRNPRIPSDLGPIPFLPPGYFPGYSPKTFTPHLITHNVPPVLAAPVSPHHHMGIPNYHLGPGRLEITGQTKPDHNCPYHGKKAAEKMIHHAPGYPIIHGDPHLLGRVPFHDELTAMKMREKYREQLELVPDALGIPRRLPTIYDHPMMVPHGIHGPAIHHPGYLPPGIIDEHSYMERELLKRRMEAAAYPIHDPAKYAHAHAHNSAIEEQRNAAKKITSSPEKSPKHIGSPSVEHRHMQKRPPSAEKGERITGERETRQQNIRIVSTRSLSPKQERYLKNEHFDIKKHGKHPASPVRITAHTTPPPGNLATRDQRFMHHDKKSEVGTSPYHPRQLPRTLDQESISRDFDERFNMLNRTFKEKMEAAEHPEKVNRDKTIFLENSPGHRRPAENHHSGPLIPRPRSHEATQDLLQAKYKLQTSPGGRLSPPIRTQPRYTSEEIEQQQRRLLNGPPRKPTMTGYRPEPGIVPREHELQTRESLAKAAYIRGLPHHEYPPYDVTPWGVTAGRIPGYPPGRNPVENQKPVSYKSEREKLEYASSQREQQEKDIDLAREKHRINLAHFEQERTKAMMNHERSRILTRPDDDGRPRITGSLDQRPTARMREEALRREEMESRKRKMEEANNHGPVSPYEKNLEAKRTKLATKEDLIPERPMEVPGDLDPRKEHYLSMYGKSRINPAYRHHMSTVPYSGGVSSPGNAPYYVGRFDLQLSKHERSVSEAMKKQRESNGEEPIQKTPSNEKDLETSEMAKKRTKLPRMCDVCGKEASFLCSVCQKAWYCSPKCQLKAWSEHSKECGEAKRR